MLGGGENKTNKNKRVDEERSRKQMEEYIYSIKCKSVGVSESRLVVMLTVSRSVKVQLGSKIMLLNLIKRKVIISGLMQF